MQRMRIRYDPHSHTIRAHIQLFGNETPCQEFMHHNTLLWDDWQLVKLFCCSFASNTWDQVWNHSQMIWQCVGRKLNSYCSCLELIVEQCHPHHNWGYRLPKPPVFLDTPWLFSNYWQLAEQRSKGFNNSSNKKCIGGHYLSQAITFMCLYHSPSTWRIPPFLPHFLFFHLLLGNTTSVSVV